MPLVIPFLTDLIKQFAKTANVDLGDLFRQVFTRFNSEAVGITSATLKQFVLFIEKSDPALAKKVTPSAQELIDILDGKEPSKRFSCSPMKDFASVQMPNRATMGLLLLALLSLYRLLN